MALHVVVGAGPVGSALARLLAERGEQVRLISLTGDGPSHQAIERIKANASHAQVVRERTEGAVAIYNCANPHPHHWPAEWPRLAGALMHAAESTGAVLAVASDLHAYGPVRAPITEETPLRPATIRGAVRARMWHDAREAHRAGRLRMAEVRGSDDIGAGARSLLSQLVIPAVLAGRRVAVPGDLDAPHSWTYVGDVARMLAVTAADERAWGRAWHVPTAPPVSLRAVAQRVAELAGAPPPQLTRMPKWTLWVGGLFDRRKRHLREVAYQFASPFVLESAAARTTFGIEPTPLDDALRETIDALRAPAA